MRFLLGCALLIPVSFIVPKENNIVLIPRFGHFEGNLKYLYLYLSSLDEDINVCFLTHKKALYNELKKHGLNALFYPSLSTIYKLLRTRIIVVDGNEWSENFKFYLLYNTVKIQLWHGTGMKTVGLLNPNKRPLKNNLINNLLVFRDLCFYDLLTLSSEYQAEARAKAFRYGDLLINGLPRNDIFFKAVDNNIGCDNEILRVCRNYKENGYQIITYAPTWRDGNSGLSLKLEALNVFAENNKLLFVIKLHNKHSVNLELDRYDHILEYNKDRDVYPLLGITDLLITDYSSIYLDYLLTGKPVVFYPYDYDNYIQSERKLQFDYSAITPGPKCYNQEELLKAVKTIGVEGRDDYVTQRKEVLQKFHHYNDGNSAERLWLYIKDNFLEE